MRILFVTGLGLLGCAFVSAAAEIGAKVAHRPDVAILSAIDLWRAMSPGTFAAARDAISGMSAGLWDPVLVTLLVLPAWLLFGLPGGLLAWRFRPNRNTSTGMSDDDISPDSLYENLAQMAKDEGYDKNIDDMAPANLKRLDWGHDKAALATGRNNPHEDMGEESSRFVDALAKRAAADDVAAPRVAKTAAGKSRPAMPPVPGSVPVPPKRSP